MRVNIVTHAPSRQVSRTKIYRNCRFSRNPTTVQGLLCGGGVKMDHSIAVQRPRGSAEIRRSHPSSVKALWLQTTATSRTTLSTSKSTFAFHCTIAPNGDWIALCKILQIIVLNKPNAITRKCDCKVLSKRVDFCTVVDPHVGARVTLCRAC